MGRASRAAPPPSPERVGDEGRVNRRDTAVEILAEGGGGDQENRGRLGSATGEVE